MGSKKKQKKDNQPPPPPPPPIVPPRLPPILQIIFDIQEAQQHLETIEDEIEDFYNDDDYDEIITSEINSIDDLIKLGKLYEPIININNKRKKYNINVKRLYDLIEPLEKLKAMVGMHKVKDHILNMIIYYLQDFQKYNKNMMHTVLYGPPGSGKTELAHILAKIYCKIGIIKRDYVHIVKRSDIIGQYLGHTAVQTQKAIDAAKDGVLLIDEAYSLGNREGKDSFSKECIDTLNQNLTEGKNKFICIIAGYKDDLDKCFFSYNKGLERRFPFRFTIDDYNEADLKAIFIKKINEEGWNIDENQLPLIFFKDKKKYFTYNGGDMETLFHLTQIAHARRVFCLPKNEKKNIIYEDVIKGFDLFISNDDYKKRNHNDHPSSMYI